ncbi:MAG: hypothetical protein QOE01_1385 [Actinomycetota bacterium]|jgi:hypothetical protein|nr:hypothetical protein [Actinomycetota bacterium]
MEADVRRVADRLRGLSQARLAAPVPGHPSRAAAGRALATRLAHAAQGVEGRGDPAEPTWRDLPELSDFAVGDQVAVTGNDLFRSLAGLPTGTSVWASPGRRVSVGRLLSELGDAVAEARRLL